MVRKQKGFTIIELVVVIVILGILAAVAFPKFQDLSGDARTAVVNGTAAALKSAAVISYARAQGSASANTLALVKTQTTFDSAVNITGSCAAALVRYGATTKSVTVDISEYCSG